MIVLGGPEGYPHVNLTVSLSGSSWVIKWFWNDRDRTWSFSMDDPSGDPLIEGVRVVPDVDLLHWAPADRRPPHALLVVDPSRTAPHITRENLGSVYQIVYTQADE